MRFLVRHAAWLAPLLGVIVALNTLRISLFMDDHIHLAILERKVPSVTNPLDLFTFANGDPEVTQTRVQLGPFPWWTKPDVKLSFFRPLSSALVWFDLQVFGRHFLLWHLHSLAWYAALIAVVGLVLRRLCEHSVAALAQFLFAIDGGHWTPVGWLANRNALVAATFGLIAVWCHLRVQQRQWKPGLYLGPVAFALALLSGEVALGAAAMLGACELVGTDKPWRERARALAPFVVVGLGWAAVYRTMGFGAYASGIYIDPGRSTLDFLLNAGPRWLAMTAGLLFKVPTDAFLLHPLARYVLAVLGVLAVAFFRAQYRALSSFGERATQRSFAVVSLGAALAMIPPLATFPADRLNLIPSIGGAAFVSTVLHRLWGMPGWKERLTRRLLVFAHGLVALAPWVVNPNFVHTRVEAMERATRAPEVPAEDMQKRVVMVATADFPFAFSLPLIRISQGFEWPQSYWFLSIAPYPHRWTRVSLDAFDLEVLGGTMLETVFEQMVRSPNFPVHVGETFDLDGAVVTVLEMRDGRPSKIRFAMTAPVSEFTFVEWTGRVVKPLALPPLGKTLDLPEGPGPFETFPEDSP